MAKQMVDHVAGVENRVIGLEEKMGEMMGMMDRMMKMMLDKATIEGRDHDAHQAESKMDDPKEAIGGMQSGEHHKQGEEYSRASGGRGRSGRAYAGCGNHGREGDDEHKWIPRFPLFDFQEFDGQSDPILAV
ncbi:hypothetical protein GUJ93_ZPchr0004g39584 [Zizania palustris]|uniref:Uncharacterized protein n=1 Tax=Zizania palustris TaxID=103762 RepID=A0A8J5VYM2_ZIZPA|nr:hypothetical protein GUJ93_ZPchr0004g39584 [Zizania palustris]